MDRELIFNIFSMVIGIISIIITRYVIPYVKSMATNQKLSNIMVWVREAVNAAEQIYNGVNLGEKKKNYVVSRILDISNKSKLNLTEQEVILLLESVVKKMNDKKGEY